jgi:hypothetical protein
MDDREPELALGLVGHVVTEPPGLPGRQRRDDQAAIARASLDLLGDSIHRRRLAKAGVDQVYPGLREDVLRTT